MWLSCAFMFSCGFHVFQVFHMFDVFMWFSCADSGISFVFIILHDIMFILASFYLDWPAKQTPTSPVRPAWNAGFEGGKPDLWEYFFAGQSKWKISSSHVYIYISIDIVSCCVCSLFHSELSCLHVLHVLSCLNSYTLCFVSWFGACGVFPILTVITRSINVTG